MWVDRIKITTVNIIEFSWQRTLSYFAYLQTDMLVVANTASMSTFRICLIHNSLRFFPKFYLPANILFASNNIELSMKFTCFWQTITYHLPPKVLSIQRKTHWHYSKNTIFQRRWRPVCILHAYRFSLDCGFWRAILRAKYEQNNQQMLTLFFCAGSVHHIPIDEQPIFRLSKFSYLKGGKICKKYL